VIKATPRPLYPRKEARFSFYRKLRGPQIRLGCLEKKKKFAPARMMIMMMILITLATTTITNSGINSGPMTSCVHSHSLCSHQTKFRLFQNSFPFVEFNAKLIVSTPTLHACEGKIISVHVMKAYKEVKA